MSMKAFLSASLLALSLPLAAAALSPSAKALAPAPTQVPAAVPASPSAAAAIATAVPTAIAAPLSPAAESAAPALPSELSGTPEVLGAPAASTVTGGVDEPVIAEEVGEDGGIQAKLESPDLDKQDSETLASIAAGVDKDSNEVFFDPAAKQALKDAAPGAWRVNVDALYYELAKRTLHDNKDKAARQAFALTLFKDADRAKFAKDLAFDDKLADTVIAQLEGGRPRARMELQTLAEKGNRKARSYLGLDRPTTRMEAGALSGTAQATSSTAAALPSALSPSAAPVANSETAALSPTASAVSKTAAALSTPVAGKK